MENYPRLAEKWLHFNVARKAEKREGGERQL
jgi:hypothetical protein